MIQATYNIKNKMLNLDYESLSTWHKKKEHRYTTKNFFWSNKSSGGL